MAASVTAAARRRWPLLLLVAIAARALTFGDPLVHADEQFYFVVAKAMWHGQLPYLDIWDRKPIGLFLLYMPAAALPLPWGTLAYQGIALACVVATAGLVARFAVRAGWAKGATAAGIAYILWLDLLNGSSGQSPVFYNLPVAAAAWLVATRAGARGAGLAAMALVGIAIQIKPTVVFEGAFLGVWLLLDARRARRARAGTIAYAVALVGLALLPTATAYAFYAVKGIGALWWQANVVGTLTRLADPPSIQLAHGASLLLVLSPLIAMAGASRREPVDGDPRLRRFLWCWLGAVLGGVVVFGGWYDHYGLPVVAPAAACAAGFLGGRGRRHAALILAFAALTGQVVLGINRARHGDLGQLRALFDAVGRGPGTLFVYSGPPLIYGETGRSAPTRYIFPSHLYLAREEGSIGVRQADETRRILATRPATIVTAPPYRTEEPHIRAIVEAALRRDYRLGTRLPLGRATVSVYRLRADAVAAPAPSAP